MEGKMRPYDIKALRSKPVSSLVAEVYAKSAKGKKEYAEFSDLCRRRFPIRTFNLSEQDKKAIFVDHVYLRYKYGLSMTDYFLYELYRGVECVENMYMSDRDRVEIHRAVNQPEYLHYFGNKKDFYEKFGAYMLKDCMFVESKEDEPQFRSFVSDKDRIVIKPRDGQRGIGVEIVPVGTEEEIRKAWEKCLRDHLLVEKVLTGCDEIQAYHEPSLNTIRVSTVLDPQGKPHILSATIRTGTGSNVVDNGHSGGVYAAIDVDTGMLTTIGYNANGDRYPVHPDSGKPFAGFFIPKWDELREKALEVAQIIPQMRYIGWDWVLTSDRQWILIEGNEPGGIDVHQHPGLVMKKEQYRKMLGLD